MIKFSPVECLFGAFILLVVRVFIFAVVFKTAAEVEEQYIYLYSGSVFPAIRVFIATVFQGQPSLCILYLRTVSIYIDRLKKMCCNLQHYFSFY